MAKVTFLPSKKTVEVPEGTTLFSAAHRMGLPIASSCSAESVCARCNMQIIAGSENLSPPTDWEKKLLLREKSPPGDRISCLAEVYGDCTVTTRYW